MTRKRIAIIGGGFSGVCLASLLMRAKQSVTLIERGARLGAGLAYGVRDDSYLLNVRASNMSAFADDPDHFARWLRARTGQAGEAFAARKLYGAYMGETLRRESGAFGRRLKRLRHEVRACERLGNAWRIRLASGTLEADAVVLALGHRPPRNIAAMSDIAVIGAWDRRALRRVGSGDVLLLGTGLTMVDVALALARRRRDRVIHALSRRGLTPRPHLDPPWPRPSDTFDLPLRLCDAVAAFRAEAARLAAEGEPWQQAMERLRPHTTPLWTRLSPTAQRRFLRHLRPWWDVHRHRMAPEAAADIAALQTEGRLRIIAGEVIAAEQMKGKVAVEYRRRTSVARNRLDVAGIVNCTGGDADLRRSNDPLIVQLIDAGLARPHASGLGFDLDDRSRVIDAEGRPHDDLYALGPLTQGAFWESTAAPDIRVWASRIAAELC
ncbi:MAG TPA: FAD/NAD(P)-binding protein [Vitreimonas sp.]|uniref:FAD/NAD(P)-binding protein n=1 Tax=Vitreimonas sp. TaxID=3069702 RepID=UPI002D5AB582|nr:FAD/NAD(P)-binding protein [Vitreimonas sp.]HYD88201.1 FAD/NAD(P)-binding protein [Vitreimonas sp.]